MATSIITTTTFTLATIIDVSAAAMATTSISATVPAQEAERDVTECEWAAVPRCAWTARKHCGRSKPCKA